jgi:hypothetical protein
MVVEKERMTVEKFDQGKWRGLVFKTQERIGIGGGG